MASLDFIRNLLSREQGQGQNYPELPLIQVNEQGGLETDPVKMAQAQLGLKQTSTPLTTTDRLFGRDMTQDYQAINPETGQAQMATLTNHKPGFFEDFGRGFQENATQGFNVNNLAPVQGKGLATRLGEGLGTLARFYDKPIGRMAVATGLSMLTDEANPLNEGVKAYVGRQTNMTRDKAYRQNLRQMGYSQEEIDSIPGIMSDDIYKNLIDALNTQEMRKYREAYLTNQQEQNKIMNQFRQDQLKYQRMQDAYDRAQKNREFNYRASQDAINNNLKLKELALKGQKNASGNINNLNAVNAQLQRFEESFANMPNKIESNTLGRLRAATGFQTKQEANFNSQRQLLFNKIARDLGGEKGVLSDQDIKRIEGALPSYTDSLEQKNAKMSAIYDLLNDRLAVEGGSLQQPQQKSKAIQVGNYKVRVK